MNEKITVDQIITEKMCDLIKTALANGECAPWHKPWFGGAEYCWSRDMAKDCIRHGKKLKTYSLLNMLFLLFENKPGEYVTELQGYEQGYAPKIGEKPSMVFYYGHKVEDRKDENGKTVIGDDGKPEKITIWFLRYYSVYHVSQMEKCNLSVTLAKSKKTGKEYKKYTVTERLGEEMTPVWKMEERPEAPKIAPIETAESVFRDYINRNKIAFEQYGAQAFYSPSQDKIVIPAMDEFVDISEYYSTLYHQTVHSTGHEKRLNRIKSVVNFGNHDYSKEELVAEMGACCALHRLGINTEKTVKNSQAYLQAWLKKLQNNTRWLSSAATKAEKAVRLIFGESDKIANDSESEE